MLGSASVKHPLSDPAQRLALDAALLKLLDEDRGLISELVRGERRGRARRRVQTAADGLALCRAEEEDVAQAEAGAPHSTSPTPQT